jgi:hypothetical protein
MKNKLLIGGILGTVILVIAMGAIMMSYNAQQREQELSQSSLATDTRDHCGEKYLMVGNDECVLNPEFIEPNTIIIYDVTENGKPRLSIAPHTLVMNLTDGNIIRFVNDGSTTVNVFDKAKGIWRFDDVKPSSQRILTINNTGFYEVLIQNSREGESGRIVVLDNDVNSLSVSDRIKMGKAIISNNFREYPELVSVGAGSGEIGVHVTINKKELELHEDAKSYYHEKFSKIIPFEVPIVIEFGEPIEPE